jgi:hypothetical protein
VTVTARPLQSAVEPAGTVLAVLTVHAVGAVPVQMIEHEEAAWVFADRPSVSAAAATASTNVRAEARLERRP